MFRLKLNNFSPNLHRISLLIFSSYLSFFQVRRFRSIGIESLSDQLLNPLPFEDSPLYLFQLKRFREGIYSFGDGALFEGVNSGYSAGSSFYFAFWGSAGNLFNLNLLNTYTLMVFFSSAILYLITYIFIADLGIGREISKLLAIPIYFLAFGFELGRPSPTQQTLWLAILAFSRVVKLVQSFSMNNVILVNSLIVILLLCNPIYGLAVFVFFFLSVFMHSQNKSQRILTTLPAALALLIFNLVKLESLTIEEAEQLARFGVFYSRLPGGFSFSIQLLSMAFLLRILHKRLKLDSTILLSNLNLSILVALNSQVITNKNFEMQSHLGYLAKFTLLTSFFYLAVKVFQIYWKNIYLNTNHFLLIIFNVSVLFILTMLPIPPSVEPKNFVKNSNMNRLIHELDQKKYSEKVFIVPLGVVNLKEISYLALNTKIKLYWYPEAVYSVISDRELFERFACVLRDQVTRDDVFRYESFLFAHKYVNREQFYSKWNSLLAHVGLKTAWDADRHEGYEDARRQISRFQENCNPGKFSNRIDYVIDNNLTIREISK